MNNFYYITYRYNINYLPSTEYLEYFKTPERLSLNLVGSHYLST